MKTAEKLRTLAEKLQPQIDNAMDPNRLADTPRRQRIAQSMREEGRHLIRTQKALLRLADMHESGAVPEILQGFTTKKAVYEATFCSNRNEEEPSRKTPENIALWELIGGKTEEEKRAEYLWKLEQEVKLLKIPGFFQTPPAVVERMLTWADLKPHHVVLEPSAGAGAIADVVRDKVLQLDCCEINLTLQKYLREKGHRLVGEDFFEYRGGTRYHRILMNPPFEKLADIDHVFRAYELFLADEGRIVSVMSPSPFFHTTKKAEEFREWFDSVGGIMEPLPEGSFKPSGTGVNTCLVRIDK